MIVVNTKFL